MLKNFIFFVAYEWAQCAREFSLASLSNLVKCFWVRQGAYPREEHLKAVFFVNIRLGGRGLPRINTLDY